MCLGKVFTCLDLHVFRKVFTCLDSHVFRKVFTCLGFYVFRKVFTCLGLHLFRKVFTCLDLACVLDWFYMLRILFIYSPENWSFVELDFHLGRRDFLLRGRTSHMVTLPSNGEIQVDLLFSFYWYFAQTLRSKVITN